jgi:hypothetical protein
MHCARGIRRLGWPHFREKRGVHRVQTHGALQTVSFSQQASDTVVSETQQSAIR